MGVFSLEIKKKKNSEQTALKWSGLGVDNWVAYSYSVDPLELGFLKSICS